MRRHRITAALAALVAVLVLSAVDLYARFTTRPPGTADEVLARARGLGLHVLETSVFDDDCHTVLVSEEPIATWPVIRLGNPDASAWRGRLLVTDYQKSGIIPIDPPSQAVWGNLHVFGDTRLIARVAAKR